MYIFQYNKHHFLLFQPAVYTDTKQSKSFKTTKKPAEINRLLLIK